MKKIIIKYNNREVIAVLLARFDMMDNEFVSVKGLFGRTKEVLMPMNRQYCLVFIPWKDKEKELALISVCDIITMDKLIGNDIVSVEKYISPFEQENPYHKEYQISNFIGYNFIYEYKNFIADIRNHCFDKPLEILYYHKPELLHQQFE